MSNLQEARDQIRIVDEQMAALFEQRMAAVKEVAEYKRQRGLPVLDEAQEQRVVDRNSGYISDPVIKDYYIKFLRSTMAVSREYQHRLIEGVRVAYSGIEGAFAHIAARRIFPDGQPVSYPSFDAAYNAVVSGACDFAVLPIENSYAGEVGQVIDLMFFGDLFINGLYDLPVSQNLLGLPGARITDIDTVISHPQALGQCEKYIRSHGFAQISAVNTAMAAKQVAEEGDIHTAVIASAETAEIYGLEMLDHDINESRSNTTRFAVFSRVENNMPGSRDSSAFLLMFSVNNTAGSLAEAINIIGKYGFNMTMLRSRPTKDLPWAHYFFAETQGDELSPDGQAMLKELGECCPILKTVGRFNNGHMVLQEAVK